jgi:hypothetical protein
VFPSSNILDGVLRRNFNIFYHSFFSYFLYCPLILNVNIRKYKIIILPVVLYGCEIWSPTLREVRRLRVFENRVLRRICGPKRDEVAGGLEKIA